MLGPAESSGASGTQRVPKTHPTFGPRWQLLAFLRHVCLIGPSGFKHFQTIHPCGVVDVAVARDDGREQTFRIVREDEADPAHRTVSYVIARRPGRHDFGPGDTVEIAGRKAEILDVR